MRTAASATTAVTTFTTLSSASEYSATDPVIQYARYFRPSTTISITRLPAASFVVFDVTSQRLRGLGAAALLNATGQRDFPGCG